jgi:GNAT superfamily N-acetyltransferase
MAATGSAHLEDDGGSLVGVAMHTPPFPVFIPRLSADAAAAAADALHAVGARSGGTLVGIVHFLEHPSTTAAEVRYLQNLFTAPRGSWSSVGRALIAAVVESAKSRGCSRVCWVTHESKTVARALYDKLALNSGFVRYQIGV